MVNTRTGSWRQKALVGVLFAAVVVSNAWQGPAGADVSEVSGSAYGYSASVSIFGGPPIVAGPTPTVTLPSTGGNETDSAPSGQAGQGIAIFFESGPLNVSTEGATGPGGSVTSSASIDDIGPGPFTASAMSSTCTASEAGITGSTSLTDGVLVLMDPDDSVSGEEGEVIVSLPANPAPNTQYEGVVANIEDNFTATFNEQTVTEDSITVNALHLAFEGPSAVGDLFVGQSVCGITSDGNTGTTTTTEPDGGTTTTTEPDGGTTTTTEPDGGTTTTTEPDGGTTTTTEPDGGTTTTTEPDGGTTTTTEPDGGTTTTTEPDGGDDDCEEPEDFVGQLIFQIFRSISDLFERLGISGFEDFGCDLD